MATMQVTDLMHPRIAELARILLPMIGNPPANPTSQDRNNLMAVHEQIKRLPEEVELDDTAERDRQYLYVESARLASQQQDFYEKNGGWAPLTKEQLIAMGAKARIEEVLKTFTDGPNHDWAVREIPNIKKGLASERKRFVTMGDMATYTSDEMSGPQARYAGNKSKSWMGWVMREFGLEHKLVGY